jgi:SAM-dependent methyltransferase
MERKVFESMAENDDVHWWYVGRRRVIADLIRRYVSLPENPRILEIGCGTGHNFDMLRQFGRLDAIEVDEEVRAIAAKRLGHAVSEAPLPALPGVADRSYDLVALLDVLEHVDERPSSLASAATKLAPGGRLLVTVPAYPWMWSGHDVAHHHKLRYSKRQLRDEVAQAGLTIEKIGRFNSFLFPGEAAWRLVSKAMGWTGSDDKVPPAPVNVACRYVFGLERYIVGRNPLPFGLSLFALLSTR